MEYENLIDADLWAAKWLDEERTYDEWNIPMPRVIVSELAGIIRWTFRHPKPCDDPYGDGYEYARQAAPWLIADYKEPVTPVEWLERGRDVVADGSGESDGVSDYDAWQYAAADLFGSLLAPLSDHDVARWLESFGVDAGFAGRVDAIVGAEGVTIEEAWARAIETVEELPQVDPGQGELFS